MTVPTQKQFDDVEALSIRVLSLVKEANHPSTALNALLTAYVNLADACDVLELVPRAGIALGQAAEEILARRTSKAAPGAGSTSLH